MICDKNEWVSMQITPKMNYNPYYNKGIPLHRVLLGFIIIVGAVGVCHYKLPSLIVHMCEHYYSKTQHVPIYIQLEWPFLNGSIQDWSKNQSSFQFFMQWNLKFVPLQVYRLP
jgi:hypothetical protein